MALAIGRYTDLSVVYDRRLESGSLYMDKLQEKNIKCIDVSRLKKVIAAYYETTPLLFHCHGFSHLRKALKIARPIDKVMISVHCFRHATWYAKWMALITYFLFFRSVNKWHFLCQRSRDEYFWYKKIPSNTCSFPLGVEELFMTKMAQVCLVKDLISQDIIDLTSKVNIVYIARFQAWKRHVFLLRSLRPILKGDTYLILVGEGPILDQVMDLATKLGVQDNVVFTGRVNRETVHYVLSHANLAVTVSPSETFGWCLLEPFCMGVPIVTTNVGIANSIIHDFYNGFILNKNCKEKEFLEKVKMALKHLKDIDNSDKKSLYLWDNFGKNTARCYDSLFENVNKDL